ncbi:hypothetical protein ACHAP3_003917 [Botrytis cinerea]
MEDSRRGRPLTGYGTLLSVDPGFIAAGEGANAFVSGGDGDDAKEGKEEREGGADVPPAEDYTEVGCVPGEEHLQSRLESQSEVERVEEGENGRSCYIYLLPCPFPYRACCDPCANDPL